MLFNRITIPNPAVAISLATGVTDTAIQALVLQPDDGATGALFLGRAGVTTAAYGLRLNAPAAGVPPAPIVLSLAGLSLGLLSQLYVIGTAGDILCVGYVPR